MPTSPILARADALMHRHHQAINDIDDLPVLTDSVPHFDKAQDGVPVLLDAEPNAPASPAPAKENSSAPRPAATKSSQSTDTAMRERIARELARRVEQRLSVALPRIIESAIRDFLSNPDAIAGLQNDE